MSEEQAAENVPAQDTVVCETETVGEPVSQAIIIERTELFLETYGGIAEWIKFADAKAAVVLTINGAIAGLLIPTLHDFRSAADLQNPLFISASVAFGFWLFLMVTSAVCALLCILPVRIKGRHPSIGHSSNFHPAAISAAYTVDEHERFIADCTAGSGADFEQQVLSSVLFDAHISSIKYAHVTASIKCFAVSAVAGFAYLFLIQFLSD